jgi:hypothetical protein
VASEHATKRSARAAAAHLDEFQLVTAPDVDESLVAAREGNILVPVRDYNTLSHLDATLDERRNADVVVMTVRLLSGPDAGIRDLAVDTVFTDYEQLLFTRVVALAERHGLPVRLLIVPAANVFDAIAQTALRLKSSEIALGESAKMPGREQARLLGEAWERAPKDHAPQIRVTVKSQAGRIEVFHLGAHDPDLSDDDLALVHRLWLDCVTKSGPLRHRDIVAVALEDFAARLAGPGRQSLLDRLRAYSEAQGRRSA